MYYLKFYIKLHTESQMDPNSDVAFILTKNSNLKYLKNLK